MYKGTTSLEPGCHMYKVAGAMPHHLNQAVASFTRKTNHNRQNRFFN
jgi:hypothetical protein